MLFLQSIPHVLNSINLLTNDDNLVIMNVIFLRALLAIVRLCLILSAICLFAEEDHFVSATRAVGHDFNLEEVSQSYLGATGFNHISFSLCIFYIENFI
jgi:hypothetical protein